MKRYLRNLAAMLMAAMLLAPGGIAEPVSEPVDALVPEVDAFSLGGGFAVDAPAMEQEAPEAENSPSEAVSGGRTILRTRVGAEDAAADNDRMFAAYLKRRLPSKRKVLAAVRQGGANLTGGTLRLYELLSARIRDVAAGRQTSTEFAFDEAALDTTEWHRPSDLGLSGPDDADAIDALLDAAGIDTYRLVQALLMDMPYDLYWFDKQTGWYTSPVISARTGIDGDEIRLAGLTIGMSVAQSYAAGAYTVDSRPARVASAVENIDRIISGNAARRDPDKLSAYANAICNLVEYNHDAAMNPEPPYGDPWQLICVFDGDPATKAVCEGYAKALKYLVDLSDFTGDVGCVLMSGELGTPAGSGAHMWNVISMPDGDRYLADLANSDGGDACDGSCFLKGCAGEGTGPYACAGISYTYSPDTIAGYGEDSPWLRVSNADYGAEPAATVRPTAPAQPTAPARPTAPAQPTASASPTQTPGPTGAPTAAPTPQEYRSKTASYRLNADGTATYLKPLKPKKTASVPTAVTVNGKSYKVTAIADKAFYRNLTIAKVTIGRNVKTIGKSAFLGCAKLKKVSGGTGVTTIGAGAFKGCRALTAITLNKKVASVGKNAFDGCAKLKTITVKTSKLTAKNVGRAAFRGLSSKATFRCPRKQLKAYKALFPKKGAPKKATYR